MSNLEVSWPEITETPWDFMFDHLTRDGDAMVTILVQTKPALRVTETKGTLQMEQLVPVDVLNVLPQIKDALTQSFAQYQTAQAEQQRDLAPPPLIPLEKDKAGKDAEEEKTSRGRGKK